jgi:hypothetical protein
MSMILPSSDKAPDYISSPDMAAFTIGRVVIATLTTGRPLTASGLLTRLAQIAEGDTKDIPAGVNAEMASGALQYLANVSRGPPREPAPDGPRTTE